MTVTEPIYFKRMLHTCLAFGIALAYGPKHLRLDSLGTHLVENTIGQARTTSNGPKFETIVSAFAKSEVRKRLPLKYNIKLYVSRRINDGGAKVDTQSTEGIKHADGWHSFDICTMLTERASGFDNSDVEFQAFVQDLLQFTSSLCLKKFSVPNRTANVTIVERNLKFQMKREATCKGKENDPEVNTQAIDSEARRLTDLNYQDSTF